MIPSARIQFFLHRVRNLLAHRFFHYGVLCFSLLLFWPSIHIGWFADDILHRAAHLDTPEANAFQAQEYRMRGPMRMYTFFDGNERRHQEALDRGSFPWWCDSSLRVSFWRPVTAWMSLLDYRLWPESSEWMHIHSIAWFTVLILLAHRFYRKIMGAGWVVGLAILLFAIDDIQAIPVAFLANRHILTGAVFGISSLLAHIHWRESHNPWWGFGSLGFLCLSLLASESGITVFAYLLAYAVWIEPGTVQSKIGSLIPAACVILVWRIFYSMMGYGVSGLELYVDPARSPLKFMGAVFERWPLLFLGILAFPPPEIYEVLTPLGILIYRLIAGAGLFLLGMIFFPSWRKSKEAGFWLSGTFMALIPLCAAIPGGRSLDMASFGAMGLLAQTAKSLVENSTGSWGMDRWKKFAAFTLGGIVLVRLLVSAGSLPLSAMTLKQLQEGVDRFSHVENFDPGLSRQDWIFVNPPSTVVIAYLFPLRLIAKEPIPAHIRVLAPGLTPVEVKRTDERTLLVHPQNGYMSPLQWPRGKLSELRTYIDPINSIKRFERLILNQDKPFMLGQKIELSRVTITITKLTRDQRPEEAEFIFDAPLEDPSFLWLQWNVKKWKYETFPLPGIGETITL